MSFEAYSVAIRLRLLDGVSSGLIGMASHFAAFNKHVGASQTGLVALEKRLQSIKMMGLVGGAALGVGGAALYSLKGPLEEAKKWAQESAKFASLGFGDAVNADAQKFALGMKTYGTSAVDNLTLVSDAMAVFKDLAHAQMAAPILAKMKFANEAVFGEGGRSNESKFMDMLKVIEFRGGLSSPKEFETQANFVQKVIAGSRGRVDAAAILQAQKTGGIGVSRLSNQAFYLGLEPLIQEFGGFRTGTALNAIENNLVMSRGSIASQQELMRLGLLDKDKVIFNALGQVKKVKPGAFKGADIEETEGPLALLQKVLLPAFKAHGITSDQDIIREFGAILSNSRGAGFMARVFQQRAQIEMQSNANRNAMDINQLNQTGQNTPEGKMIELHKKWADVMRELGNAVLPIAIRAITGLTTIVKGMLSFARQFPGLTKGLVLAFAGLAALMVGGGAVALIVAGFRAVGLALVLGKGLSLGGSLLNVAEGFGAVASRLGKLSVLAGTAFAGYEVGKLINKLGPDGDLGGWLGSKLFDLTHKQYDPNASNKYIRTKSAGGSTMLQSDIHIDGQKIATVVSKAQARDAARPQTSISLFDSTQGLIPAGGIP